MTGAPPKPLACQKPLPGAPVIGFSDLLCRPVAILFARRDSTYKRIEGCDVWDAERDARNFKGGMPVVAHPPCRAWGALSHMANPRHNEKELAIWAVKIVRENGGVLEHPAKSKLWSAMNLPQSGFDEWGGHTLGVDQLWWSHVASKPTKLYIVGCAPRDVPQMPLRFTLARKTITGIKGMPGHRCTQYEREYTPIAFANWLVAVARASRHNGPDQLSGDSNQKPK